MSQENNPPTPEETVNTPPSNIIPSFPTEDDKYEPVEERVGNPFLTKEEERQLLREEETLRAIEEEEAKEEKARKEREGERRFDKAYKEWEEDFVNFSAYDDGYYTY